jgi:hypothetical protein
VKAWFKLLLATPAFVTVTPCTPLGIAEVVQVTEVLEEDPT